MYEAVTSVRCGKTYSPGQSIPDGVLSDRDIKILLELGSIKATSKDVPLSSSTPEEATEVSTETLPASGILTKSEEAPSSDGGVSLTSQSILDYVNSADVTTLEKIKGVGKTTAKAMASHGAFATIDELKQLVPSVNWDSIQIDD